MLKDTSGKAVSTERSDLYALGLSAVQMIDR